MTSYGIQRYASVTPMPRHRHAAPYMAIVIEGGYLEAGDAGRIEAGPGDVILHGAFEAHQDRFRPRGATVLNLPLGPEDGAAAGRIDDVDAIVRLAERDPWAASAQARIALSSDRPVLDDWPDLLAAALRDDPSLIISDWADRMGLAAASVSRGFARAYGVTPKRFRLEARALQAVRELRHRSGSLAGLAAELGFADQAHMSRAICATTGLSPLRLRAKWVQERRGQ